MTILNTYTDIIDTGIATWGFSWIGLWFFCLGAIFLSFFIPALVYCIRDYKDSLYRKTLITLFSIATILSCILCIHSWSMKEVRIEKTVYEVTVDDTVSFNDFYNKYEILEQRGKVYVITEKEP